MHVRTGSVVTGDAAVPPRWRYGWRRSLPSGIIGWAAIMLGLLGSYGADSLVLQAAACVLGVAGIIVIVAAIVR